MGGNRPKICAAITNADSGALAVLEPAVDLWEVRIDLIGKGWRDVVAGLRKPWIATNRRAAEGGKWKGSEARRIKELLSALDLGAAIIDIELAAPGLAGIVTKIKPWAECLVSCHNLEETPTPDRLKQIIVNELAAGADICKVVTAARVFRDNLALLQLIADFPNVRVSAFATGEIGKVSRVLCPLLGGCFTYASVSEGRESAEGQIPVTELRRLYALLSGEADGWSDFRADAA